MAQICSRGEYKGYTVWWSDPEELDDNDGEVMITEGSSDDEDAEMVSVGIALSEAEAMQVARRFIDEHE